MFSQLKRVRQLTQVSGPKRAPNGNVKDSERLTRLPKFSVDSELNYQRVTGFGECHRSVKPSDTRGPPGACGRPPWHSISRDRPHARASISRDVPERRELS